MMKSKMLLFVMLIGILLTSTQVWAVEALDDLFDIRTASGLVVTSTRAPFSGYDINAMFGAGKLIYSDGVGPCVTTFSLANNVTLNAVNLIATGAVCCGQAYPTLVRGITNFKLEAWNNGSYVTLINTAVTAADYGYTGPVAVDQSFVLDKGYPIGTAVSTNKFRVTYNGYAAGWGPTIDELDGFGTIDGPAAVQTYWNLSYDFPMLLPATSDWELGFYADQIPASNTNYQQGQHYEFDTAGCKNEPRHYVQSSLAPFSYSGSGWLSDYQPMIWINTNTESWGSYFTTPYPQDGCIAMNPYANPGVDATYGTGDDIYLDAYVKWAAPRKGYFKFDLGLYSPEASCDGSQIRVSVLVNGVAVEGYDKRPYPSLTPYGVKIVFNQGLFLSANDTVELRVHAAYSYLNGTNHVPIRAKVQEEQAPISWNISTDMPTAFPDSSPLESGYYVGSTPYPFDLYRIYSNYDCIYSSVVQKPTNVIWYNPSLPALFRNKNTEQAGGGGLRPYPNDGCVAANPWHDAGTDGVYDTADDTVYDVYVSWTAPYASTFIVSAGAFKTMSGDATGNPPDNKVTILFNGTAIPGYDQIDVTLADLKLLEFRDFSAGDTIEIRIHADKNVDWFHSGSGITYTPFNVSPLYLTVTDYLAVPAIPEGGIIEDFNDGDISDWTSTTGIGLTQDIVATGYALKVDGLTAGAFATISKKFFDVPVKNVVVTLDMYKDDSKNYSCSDFATRFWDILGNAIRPTVHTASANPSSPGYGNIVYTIDYADSTYEEDLTPDYDLSAGVKLIKGWNQIKAIFGPEGGASLYVNDVFITHHPDMVGFQKLELGRFFASQDPGQSILFDNITILPLTQTHKWCNWTLDSVYQQSDLNRDCVVDMADLMVLVENWLEPVSTSYTGQVSGLADSMEYGNYETAIAGGWTELKNGVFVTDEAARSGNEAMIIRTGRNGRVGRDVSATSASNCTASIWVYQSASGNLGESEISIISGSLSPSTMVRVFVGYQFDPEDPNNTASVVKTAVGDQGTWTLHPAITVTAGWHKVSFVVSSTGGTSIYFDSTLLRTVSQFTSMKRFTVGKGCWFDATNYPYEGKLIFDDFSFFNKVGGVLAGDPNAIYPVGDMNYLGGVNLVDFATMANGWMQESVAPAP